MSEFAPLAAALKLVLALAAVEAPVPPSATARSVMPTIVPPVIAAEALSVFVATAVAILLNSVSISVPLTIFKGLPELRLSLVAKLVVLYSYSWFTSYPSLPSLA